MYIPYNYLAQVMGTFFLSYQIAFCSFVESWLCLYFRRYWLIFKETIERRHRVLNPWVKLHISRAILFFYFEQDFFFKFELNPIVANQ